MSHELKRYSDGRTAFVAGNNESAWHRLGTVKEGGLTKEDVMTALAVGKVEKLPVYAKLLTSTGFVEVEVGGKYVTVGTDPVSGDQVILGGAEHNGVVGPRYQPFQNEWLVDMLQRVLNEFGASLDTAGQLRDGADVFVTAKLPKTMLIGGVDQVDMNVALLNNHTGRQAIRGLCTPVRIVCANTERGALRHNQGVWNIRHTESARERAEEMRHGLALSFAYAEEFEVEAEKMVQETLTVDELRKVCLDLWPQPKPSDTDGKKASHADKLQFVQRLFLDGENNANIRGTRWAGYNAITEYLDHHAPMRAKNEQVRAERRATSAVDGRAAKTKERAFALLSV